MEHVYNESENFIESYTVHLASMAQQISMKWCHHLAWMVIPYHMMPSAPAFLTHKINWQQAYEA